MKILDLFCGAGGAAWGYHQAADELGIPHTITGVDIKPMPRYPFEFVLGDALEYLAAHGQEYDFIHASPPCQAYTQAQVFHNRKHPDLVGQTREILEQIGRPWIIENVPNAPIRPDLILCGSMFGLGYDDLVLIRHRLFESSGELAPWPPATCNHDGFSISVFGNSVLGGPKNGIKYTHPNERREMGVKIGRIAMGIDWMTNAELSQAIPPAYTRYIGLQIFRRMA